MIKWGIFSDKTTLNITLPKETNMEWLWRLSKDRFVCAIFSIAYLLKFMDSSEWEKMFSKWLDEPHKY